MVHVPYFPNNDGQVKLNYSPDPLDPSHWEEPLIAGVSKLMVPPCGR